MCYSINLTVHVKYIFSYNTLSTKGEKDTWGNMQLQPHLKLQIRFLQRTIFSGPVNLHVTFVSNIPFLYYQPAKCKMEESISYIYW